MNEHLAELAQPTVVQGEIKKRADAVVNDDLWKLSGRQDNALSIANGDKTTMRDYILDVSKKAREVEEEPVCSRWVPRWLCK